MTELVEKHDTVDKGYLVDKQYSVVKEDYSENKEQMDRKRGLETNYKKLQTEHTKTTIDEKEAHVTRLAKPSEPPGVPSEPFETSSIGYTEVGLTWQPPENNGGIPISSYVLEWKENESVNWMEVEIRVNVQPDEVYVTANTPEETPVEPMIEDKTTTKISYTVTGLTDGASYLFRVKAKNKQGVSEPLLMKERISTHMIKAPGKPLDFTGVFNMEDKCISLSWKPPEENGGQPVINYGLEYCSTIEKDWMHLAIVKNDTCWTGSRFTGGLMYRFRVTAHNEKGLGEPCQLEGFIKFISLPSSPAEIKVIKVESDNVTLTIQPPQNNGGLTIERYWIRKKLDGQQWTRAYEPATVETVSKAITISVVNLTQENSYHFGACAENAMGKGDFLDTDSATVLPRKMAQPGIPVGPIKVSDIKPTQLLLAWEPPVNDGGTPITSYVVSSKLAYQLYRSENRIGTTKETQYLVKDLQEGQRYLFYVYAQNEIGNSKALEIQVRTSVARVPGKPAGPLRCINLTHNSVTLTWNPPDNDGGAPLIEYEVECLYFYRHALLNKKIVNKETTSCTFGDLSEGERYTFRIHAVNRKGRSEKLETGEAVVPRHIKGFLAGIFSGDKSITAKPRSPSTDIDVVAEATDDTGKINLAEAKYVGIKAIEELTLEDIPLPGADIPSTPIGPLRIENVTDGSLDLSWKPPLADGGAELSQFEIEYSPHKQLIWRKAGTVDGTTYTYRVTELQEGTEYTFRVTAYNAEGPSKPLKSDSTIKTKAKLGNGNNHISLDEFEFRQNSITGCGISCP